MRRVAAKSKAIEYRTLIEWLCRTMGLNLALDVLIIDDPDCAHARISETRRGKEKRKSARGRDGVGTGKTLCWVSSAVPSPRLKEPPSP